MYKSLNLKSFSINLLRNFTKIKFSICFITLINKNCCSLTLCIMEMIKSTVFFTSINCTIRRSKNISTWFLPFSLITFIIIIRRSNTKCIISSCNLYFILSSCKSKFSRVCYCKIMCNRCWWNGLKRNNFGWSSWWNFLNFNILICLFFEIKVEKKFTISCILRIRAYYISIYYTSIWFD
jgi:hypothetical protein